MACTVPKSQRLTRVFAAPISCAFLMGCIAAGDGVDPPVDRIYFPVGLSVSRADTLVVVNSDFDLQFSQGTVQSLSLERVAELTLRPCVVDSDCAADRVCDDEPTEANGQAPSFVCIAPGSGPCGGLGEKSLPERAVAPGRCRAIDLDKPPDGGASLLVDVAETSAFATQGLLVARPCQDGAGSSRPCGDGDGIAERVAGRNGDRYPERLFMPVRGDTTIHYLDVNDEGRFVCGRGIEASAESFATAGPAELRCSSSYRLAEGKTFGVDADGNLVFADEPPPPGDLDDIELRAIENDPINEFRLQPEPVGITASAQGRVVTVSHQVNGIVSTVVNTWLDRPRLVDVLRGLPLTPVGIEAYPDPPVVAGQSGSTEATWDFLVTYRTEPRVDLLHFDDDGLLEAAREAPTASGGPAVRVFRPALELVDSAPISTNSLGAHSRGLVFDDRARRVAVQACGEDADCLAIAEQTALTVYVTNRSPNSLLVGTTGGTSRLSETSELPRFYDNIPLTAGPSRVVLGSVTGESGEQLPRVFIICFDSAVIYVYDPERRVMETEIPTGRGPYALAFDKERPLAYVAHFTDSYVGVVSLDRRFRRTYGATLATLGIPEAPRASQ